MSEQTFISICIPVYKHVDFLKRLLDSIKVQTYRDFEVVITDDTPDDSVKKFLEGYEVKFTIRYFHNDPSLGTPENWNSAIRLARGTWIKLMHGDDWFAASDSLKYFADATKKTSSNFIFSAYQNVSAATGEIEVHQLNWFSKYMLRKSELNLFKANYIGNPSCTMIRRDVNLFYDRRLKWVVDFAFYMKYFKADHRYFYISQPLISVGIHVGQVTKYTFRRPEVELPENHLLLENMGTSILKNIFVYDYYWRLYRNLGIRDVADIKPYYKEPVVSPVEKMINQQKKIPLRLLRIGLFSKILMFISYLQFRISGSKKTKIT